MSQYDELKDILRRLLTDKFSPKPNFTRGVLGDGNGNVQVENKPDHSIVRFSRGSNETFEVFNRNVNPVDGWPVLIGELPWQPGLTQVVDTDWSAYEQSGWGDDIGATSPHAPTHEWPDGQPGSDPLNVYVRAIVPLKAYSEGTGSTTVFVNAYEYEYQGTGTTWPGIPGVDLSVPMAAMITGTARFMGVYLDPATNSLGVVTGNVGVFTPAINPDLPIYPAGVFPSANVRIYGNQGGLAEADFNDARRLFGISSSSTGTSSINPATYVITGTSFGLPPIIGASVDYARADHSHGTPTFFALAGGRITLTSGTAVTTSDVTGATNIYYTPDPSSPDCGYVSLYDGSAWAVYNFTEITLALGTLTSGKNYDVFLYNNGGVLTLELSAAWTNDTTRADALTTQDGIYVKSGATTRRYLGTIRTTSTTETEDSTSRRFLWNMYNRARRESRCVDTTNNWTYTTATWRAANNNTTVGVGRYEILIGIQDTLIEAIYKAIVTNNNNGWASGGVGIDSTSANSGQIIGGVRAATANQAKESHTRYVGYPSIGYHYIQSLEISEATGTTSWYGDVGLSYAQSGAVGYMRA